MIRFVREIAIGVAVLACAAWLRQLARNRGDPRAATDEPEESLEEPAEARADRLEHELARGGPLVRRPPGRR